MRIKWYLDTRGKKADEVCPLLLVFRNVGTAASFTTSFSLLPSFWDMKAGKVIGGKNKTLLQRSLDEYMHRMIVAMEKSCGITSRLKASVIRDRTVAMYDGRICTKDDTFLKVFEHFITMRERPASTVSSFRYTIDKVRAYSNMADALLFEDITEEWVISFEAWLTAQGLKVNTVAIHLENVRTVVNFAVRSGFTSTSPFRLYKIRREASEKRALSFETMCEIWHYDGGSDFERLCVDMFKLQMALCGINMMDLFSMGDDNLNDGRLTYIRTKTKKHGVKVSVKVEPEAQELINRHKGDGGKLLNISSRWKDYRSFLHAMNKTLGNIGPVVKKGRGGKIVERHPLWPNLTSYYSRHSVATLLSRLGTPVDVIAMGLGHKLSAITYRYITPDYSSLDNAMRRMLDCLNASSLDIGIQSELPDGVDMQKVMAILAIVKK